MGHAATKPDPPTDNKAKAESDLAMAGMQLAADNFLQELRLGTASTRNLGYQLVGNKLEAQEIRMISKTADNVTADTIKDCVKACFSGDWETVVNCAIDEIIPFLAETPDPMDTSVDEEFMKSYLVWEFNTLIQYSVYIKKTISQSVGTFKQNEQYNMISCLARGIVDYEFIDPQVIIYEVGRRNPDMKASVFVALLDDIEAELTRSVRLSLLKRQLAAGMLNVEETAGSGGKGGGGSGK